MNINRTLLPELLFENMKNKLKPQIVVGLEKKYRQSLSGTSTAAYPSTFQRA